MGVTYADYCRWDDGRYGKPDYYRPGDVITSGVLGEEEIPINRFL